MRILVIGGTRFFGRAVVELSTRRGHAVTLFHRGITGEAVFPDVEHIHGDRTTDIELLAGREWDAVLDLFAYVPRAVRETAQVLAGSIGRYWLVSSVAVYRDTDAPSVDEDAATLGAEDLADPETEVVDFQTTFGPLKGMCEQAAREGFSGRASVLRPTFMVGPNDPTDRFTYWVRRIAAGGEVLCPSPSDAPQQVIDARDLASFAVDLIERDENGTFNGVGPAATMTFASMLSEIIDVLDSDASLTWVDPGFLRDRGVTLGDELGTALPLWRSPERYVRVRVDPARSIASGLRFRSLATTARDTLDWDTQRGSPLVEEHLERQREAELLSEWASRA